ncbi:hypothetical protein U9M48_017626, partial [Paspalum notatum var. saurae]
PISTHVSRRPPLVRRGAAPELSVRGNLLATILAAAEPHPVGLRRAAPPHSRRGARLLAASSSCSTPRQGANRSHRGFPIADLSAPDHLLLPQWRLRSGASGITPLRSSSAEGNTAVAAPALASIPPVVANPGMGDSPAVASWFIGDLFTYVQGKDAALSVSRLLRAGASLFYLCGGCWGKINQFLRADVHRSEGQMLLFASHNNGFESTMDANHSVSPVPAHHDSNQGSIQEKQNTTPRTK